MGLFPITLVPPGMVLCAPTNILWNVFCKFGFDVLSQNHQPTQKIELQSAPVSLLLNVGVMVLPTNGLPTPTITSPVLFSDLDTATGLFECPHSVFKVERG